MADLQPRKIPILTGINDVPATVGQPNYPNDSLLCANYNGLVDDVETELTTVKDDVTTLQGDVTTIQGDVVNLQGDFTILQASIGGSSDQELFITVISENDAGGYDGGINFQKNDDESFDELYVFNEFVDYSQGSQSLGGLNILPFPSSGNSQTFNLIVDSTVPDMIIPFQMNIFNTITSDIRAVINYVIIVTDWQGKLGYVPDSGSGGGSGGGGS